MNSNLSKSQHFQIMQVNNIEMRHQKLMEDLNFSSLMPTGEIALIPSTK